MKRRVCAACLALICCICLSACTAESVEETPSAESFSFRMDTWIQQRWYGELAQQTCDEIDAALGELENQISLYSDSSEIAQINAAAGESFVPVSDTVYQLLQKSIQICEETGGLFDITVAPLAILWNVTGDSPSVPSDEEIAAAQSLVDYRKVLFDDENRAVMLADAGMKLDLGGAAKGMAAGMMREIAVKNNVSGFLSIGGNMLVVGTKPDQSDFSVGIRDPRGESTDYFATVTLDGYTMATTGDYERYFEQDGVRYHHVIDPFTGYPSTQDLISVTVISEDGLLADCLSTAIFLQGSECLSDYFSRSDCMVLAVTDTFEVYASPDFWERMTPLEGTKYTFRSDGI